MENISCMKIPGSFPEEDSGIDVSAPSTPPSTPCRTKSRPRNHQEPSTLPRGAPAQRYITPKAPVGPLVPESRVSSCREDDHSPWGSPERNDGNTSSACTTPSPPRHRLAASREGSPSPTTARRSTSGAGLPRVRSSLAASATSSKPTVPTSIRTIELRHYESHPSQKTVHEVFNMSMGPSDFLDGIIYVYRTRENPGLLKVGYTRRELRIRLREWKTQCKQVPILLYVYPGNAGQQPFARRIESLIGAELKDHRKLLPACQYCDERHGKWYDIELAQLVPVIKKWSKLINLKNAAALTSRPRYLRSKSGLTIKVRKGVSKKRSVRKTSDCKITDYFFRISAPLRKRAPQKKPKPPSPGKTTITTTTIRTTHKNSFILTYPSTFQDPILTTFQTLIWQFLTKILPVYIAISFLLSFYPYQDCLAVRLVLVFVYVYTRWCQKLV